MKRVLVVDDEENLTSLVKAYLEKDGYNVAVAGDGREGLATARRFKPDIIILDRMMPEMDGLEFLQAYRAESDTPVIFLTARVEEQDRVLGLELGADDYIIKPFYPRELISRVRAILRRDSIKEESAQVLSAGPIRLDTFEHTVTINNEHVYLTPSEFELLRQFMAHPGRAFTRLDLLDSIQGTRYEGYERTIDLHIKNLRAKLGKRAEGSPYIETVYGIGYRFQRTAP